MYHIGIAEGLEYTLPEFNERNPLDKITSDVIKDAFEQALNPGRDEIEENPINSQNLIAGAIAEFINFKTSSAKGKDVNDFVNSISGRLFESYNDFFATDIATLFLINNDGVDTIQKLYKHPYFYTVMDYSLTQMIDTVRLTPATVLDIDIFEIVSASAGFRLQLEFRELGQRIEASK
jgi:hypothetical protein